MAITRIWAVAAALAAIAQAQVPAFDVASIRRGQRGEGPRGLPAEIAQVTPDGVTLRGVNLKAAIRWAYHVYEYQVSGPDWINTERYDIAAKAAGAVPVGQLRLMMQGLLAERFKLAVHRETKELPAFLLTLGKDGPKFQESKDEGESKVQPDPLRFTVTVSRMPASQVVEILSNVLKAPVVDRTGLQGKYDVAVSLQKYLPEPGANATTFDMTSTIVKAFQEELGLKLESKKLPIDLVVVDNAEKAPTEN